MIQNKPDYISKIVIIGETCVGKTFLSLALCNLPMKDNGSTVGTDILKFTAINDKNQRMMVQVWDTAGQERYRTLTNSYLRGADLIIFVFSIVDQNSLNQLKNWAQAISDFTKGKEISIVFVGNKLDLELEYEIGEKRNKFLTQISSQLCQQDLDLFVISAKTGRNVQKLKQWLIAKLYKNKKKQNELGKRPIYLSVAGSSDITKSQQKPRSRRTCC